MRAYKLIDLIDVAVTINNIWITGADGGKKLASVRLVPGREYYDLVDDPIFCSSIENAHRKFDWTQELEDALKAEGVRYEIPHRTCSCQRKKLDIWCVEILS